MLEKNSYKTKAGSLERMTVFEQADKFDTEVDYDFWNIIFYNRKVNVSSFFEAIIYMEQKLAEASQRQEYQIINDVEFALGIGPFGPLPSSKAIVCPDPLKFDKALSKSLSVQVGKELLPFALSMKDFVTFGSEKSSKLTHKCKPEFLIYVAMLSETDFWDCFERILCTWRLLPASVKKASSTLGYSESEVAMYIFIRIHRSFMLNESDLLKINSAVFIQSVQNRNLGRLVGMLHKLVLLPPVNTALELELSSDNSFLKSKLFGRESANAKPKLNIPTGQEVKSASVIASTILDCGGEFAGPEFLFSGKLSPQKFAGTFTQNSENSENAEIELKHKPKSKSKFFESSFKHHNPLRGRLLNVVEDKADSEGLVNNFNILKVKTLKVESNLSSIVRWKTKGGVQSTDLVTGLHSYLAQLLNEKSESSLSTEETEEISKWELEPEFVFNWNGLEISETEFVQTNYSSDEKIVTLTNGAKIEKSDYEGVLKLYLTRKRTFARMGEIGFHNLFKAGISAGAYDSKSGIGSGDEFAALMDMHLNDTLKTDEKNALNQMTQILHDKKPLAPNAELWRFQSYAVAWILSRFRMGLNACLADEMGLGKTITSICTIALLQQKIKEPVLILAPKSLVTNWKSELKKFAPHLTVAELENDTFPPSQIVVCGYHKFRNWNLRKENSLPQISLLILDEAHVLKNSDTKISEVVRTLNATYKLALTGTPLENHLGELWNLLDILNAGFLGGVTSFRRYAELARKKAEHRERLLSPLRDFLWAVMLRRTKTSEEVKLDLPDKIFSHEKINLSPEQSVAYKSVIEMSLNKGLLAKTSFGQRAIFLKAILHLKQICVHPDVFFTGDEDEILMRDGKEAEYAQIDAELRAQCLKLINAQQKKQVKKDLFQDILDRSDKFSRLFEILNTMKETESGILIFTQFLSAADLLQKTLNLSGETQWKNVSIFNGSLTTLERDKIIADFRAKCAAHKAKPTSACPILILSLKAGGVGLNLTSASAVIHLDRWWNPAVEDQATDRAHRMGQADTVTVVTLTAKNTIEESLDEIINSKRSLADDILGQGAVNALAESVSSPEGFEQLVDPSNVFGSRGKN